MHIAYLYKWLEVKVGQEYVGEEAMSVYDSHSTDDSQSIEAGNIGSHFIVSQLFPVWDDRKWRQ